MYKVKTVSGIILADCQQPVNVCVALNELTKQRNASLEELIVVANHGDDNETSKCAELWLLENSIDVHLQLNQVLIFIPRMENYITNIHRMIRPDATLNEFVVEKNEFGREAPQIEPEAKNEPPVEAATSVQ